jgi:hypothetical protein
MAMGDLNGDGFMDIVRVTADWGFYVRLNAGVTTAACGSWAFGATEALITSLTGAFQDAINQIRLADVNGDGRLDVVIAVDTIWWLENQGTDPLTGLPTWGGWRSFSAYQFAYTWAWGVKWVGFDAFDFNGDGRLDFIVVRQATLNPGIHLLIQNADGTLTDVGPAIGDGRSLCIYPPAYGVLWLLMSQQRPVAAGYSSYFIDQVGHGSRVVLADLSLNQAGTRDAIVVDMGGHLYVHAMGQCITSETGVCSARGSCVSQKMVGVCTCLAGFAGSRCESGVSRQATDGLHRGSRDRLPCVGVWQARRARRAMGGGVRTASPAMASASGRIPRPPTGAAAAGRASSAGGALGGISSHPASTQHNVRPCLTAPRALGSWSGTACVLRARVSRTCPARGPWPPSACRARRIPSTRPSR